MPENLPPDRDPVTGESLSFALLVSTLLLVITLLWALYDEAVTLRPWKDYQARFVKTYTAYLNKAIPARTNLEAQVKKSPDYQRLQKQLDDANKIFEPQRADITRQTTLITNQVTVLNKVFQEARGQSSALTYEMETSTSASAKQSLQKQIDEINQRTLSADVPQDGGGTKRVEFKYPALDKELTDLKAQRAELQSKLVVLRQPVADAEKEMTAYLHDHLAGLSSDQLEAILHKEQAFRTEIKQIHIADIDLVDRCQSCHLGALEPLTLTAADMGGQAVFASHPNPELIKLHNPDDFGCSPCHNGNGRATTGVETAHGLEEHWLWPLYDKENIEAGCQQCHVHDRYLPQATTLNDAKFLFDHRGCNGCHRYEGYDTESEDLVANQQSIKDKESQRHEDQLDIDRSIAKANDPNTSNDEAKRLYDRADNLKVTISGLDTQIEQVDLAAKSLLRERKKVGPDLKEVRMKLHKEWIPVWLQNPQDFRPGTRMPRFRLDSDQIKAISAFIWQSGVNGKLATPGKGDAEKGKELFETRGCMACHSVGEGNQSVGGSFAANLSRVGEKANYEYLVRWVHNPRERTAPYCPYEKRDLTPEDYAKHGLPYVFDVDHSTCPNDGHELQVQQMTVMPSLRLTAEEAQDIASYLMTLKKKEPTDYPAAAYMDDPALKAKGLALVRHFGCAGCHEISGMEDEGRIGTELTKEGTKPIERLDFALLTHPAEDQGWYTHKGFFEHKLENPAIYDQGMVKGPDDKLRMPNFDLKPAEITALTTFLLGSVDSALPQRYFYEPEDQRKDVQDGWKIVLKYNCVGCHRVRVGQRSILMDLPRYQSPDWKDQLPPVLIGEGARVDPDFLQKFLANPSLSDTDTNRNGVRPYLKVRMPTFFLSDAEIQTLVRFFDAMASQPLPYIAPKLEPLSPQEQLLARQLFSSEGAPCLQCHATGDPNHDVRATAPNFLLAKTRLKPDWAKRWMLDPSMMAPGTAMPSGLFKKDGDRWVFAGPTPPGFKDYTKDHADLLVRYIFAFTPEEQQKLPKAPSAPAPTAASLH